MFTNWEVGFYLFFFSLPNIDQKNPVFWDASISQVSGTANQPLTGVRYSRVLKSSNIQKGDPCWWKKSCTSWDVQNPKNNGINWINYQKTTIFCGAGFLPSTVCWKNLGEMSRDLWSLNSQIEFAVLSAVCLWMNQISNGVFMCWNRWWHFLSITWKIPSFPVLLIAMLDRESPCWKEVVQGMNVLRGTLKDVGLKWGDLIKPTIRGCLYCCSLWCGARGGQGF